MFSQALLFSVGGKEFVIRLNAYQEDFQKDAFAYQQLASTGLPIPKVIKCGSFGIVPCADRSDEHYYYAITERCAGQTLRACNNISSVLPSLFEALYKIHTFDVSHYSGWGLTDASGNGRFSSWKNYLLSFYNQKLSFTWRELFERTCMEQKICEVYSCVIQEYLPLCSRMKCWVHGDFSFDNVMSDGRKVTGVLDWAESRLGDFVYDIAYLEFWSEGIPYKKLWQEWSEGKQLDLCNFEQRMQCYMLHIGLGSLAIAAIVDDAEDYAQVKARMRTRIAAI
ncbi:aminoglycoside phosphotransferase family protein [Phormidium tenue FACHB-886]|nr:aminoglycoside phosphotransferase family protein [Phormidium tenue FACHB-886]